MMSPTLARAGAVIRSAAHRADQLAVLVDHNRCGRWFPCRAPRAQPRQRLRAVSSGVSVACPSHDGAGGAFLVGGELADVLALGWTRAGSAPRAGPPTIRCRDRRARRHSSAPTMAAELRPRRHGGQFDLEIVIEITERVRLAGHGHNSRAVQPSRASSSLIIAAISPG